MIGDAESEASLQNKTWISQVGEQSNFGFPLLLYLQQKSGSSRMKISWGYD